MDRKTCESAGEKPLTMCIPLCFLVVEAEGQIMSVVVTEHKNKKKQTKRILREYIRERPEDRRVIGWPSTQASPWSLFLATPVPRSHCGSIDSEFLDS